MSAPKNGLDYTAYSFLNEQKLQELRRLIFGSLIQGVSLEEIAKNPIGKVYVEDWNALDALSSEYEYGLLRERLLMYIEKNLTSDHNGTRKFNHKGEKMHHVLQYIDLLTIRGNPDKGRYEDLKRAVIIASEIKIGNSRSFPDLLTKGDRDIYDTLQRERLRQNALTSYN
ncbi:hypothetical protein J4204_05240 [Candidatus Woesearchaeota archaeon]|nr:hypothetical protein [Candidatus Woesearchaeota archaeon]